MLVDSGVLPWLRAIVSKGVHTVLTGSTAYPGGGQYPGLRVGS